MAHIILHYQVPHHEIGRRTTYEVRTLQHTINPAKPFRDNLDDAFAIACDRGADPNKNIRWRTVEDADVAGVHGAERAEGDWILQRT